MAKNKLCVALLLLGLSLNVPASQARGEYQTALDLYNKKDYAGAAQYFEIASVADPNNISANYYAGYCFYLAGRKTEAITSFRRLARAFPQRKEGMQAQEYLKRIDPDYGKAPAASVTAGGGATPAVKDKVVPEKKPTAASIVESMVQVKAPIGKVAAVSPAFVREVKALLVAMPLPVLTYWHDKGGSVLIYPSVVEYDMRIQNTAPRGWGEEYDWKASPALTSGNQVVVSQYRLDSSLGTYVDTSPELGVVRHEAGHALDYCMDNYCESTDFKHAYLLDAAQVPDEHRKRLDYFLQKAASGPSETFAELFCYRMGGETDTHRKETCELVHKYFPLTEKEMARRLSQLQ